MPQCSVVWGSVRVPQFSVVWEECQSASPELLKVADVQTHVCGIFLRICSKSILFNVKQEKLVFF